MDDNNRSKGGGLELGCRTRSMLVTAAVLVLLILIGGLLSQQPSAEDLARSRLAVERAEALQSWTIALGVALRAMTIIAGGILILGLLSITRAAVRWLDTQSRLIRPDQQTGQFPAVKIRRGEAVVDLNRLPDGKALTGVVGGKTAVLLALFSRHVLRREMPELAEQPAVLLAPPDTSPEQMQVTTQAQAGQALAAASRGGDAQQAALAIQASAYSARPAQGLPPLLVEGATPREVQLLLDTARREWQQGQGDETVDALPVG